MKNISKIFYKSLFLIFFATLANAENEILKIGSPNAQVTVKVFSSLTCPHCANFHKKIFENLEKEYIPQKRVKFEHHSFPLDLAALNAEIIIRCHEDNKKRFELLGKIYEKQNQWAIGSDIKIINKSIKKIGLSSGLSNATMDNCLKNETTQDQILNERIQAQKKYKIQSTPTIFINKKKYEGKHEYSHFKKAIEKHL
jgi:protein-disulfide isomerase